MCFKQKYNRTEKEYKRYLYKTFFPTKKILFLVLLKSFFLRSWCIGQYETKCFSCITKKHDPVLQYHQNVLFPDVMLRYRAAVGPAILKNKISQILRTICPTHHSVWQSTHATSPHLLPWLVQYNRIHIFNMYILYVSCQPFLSYTLPQLLHRWTQIHFIDTTHHVPDVFLWTGFKLDDV